MSIAVKLCYKDLKVTPEDVARYAGGSQYRPDAERRKLCEDMLERASASVHPAFIYSVHHMDTIDAEQVASILLPYKNNEAGSLPYKNYDAGTDFIVAAVCTLGPQLEKETSILMAQGSALESLFLDAAGVALLEALSDKVHSYLAKEAVKKSLFAGCRFGPGYGNIQLDTQKYLIQSVNAEAIGVQLSESGILIPLKSLSFWVMWTSQPPPEGSTYKCKNCALKNCTYRVAPMVR